MEIVYLLYLMVGGGLVMIGVIIGMCVKVPTANIASKPKVFESVDTTEIIKESRKPVFDDKPIFAPEKAKVVSTSFEGKRIGFQFTQEG